MSVFFCLYNDVLYDSVVDPELLIPDPNLAFRKVQTFFLIEKKSIIFCKQIFRLRPGSEKSYRDGSLLVLIPKNWIKSKILIVFMPLHQLKNHQNIFSSSVI